MTRAASLHVLRRPRSPRTIALWLALWLARRRQPRPLARALAASAVAPRRSSRAPAPSSSSSPRPRADAAHGVGPLDEAALDRDPDRRRRRPALHAHLRRRHGHGDARQHHADRSARGARPARLDLLGNMLLVVALPAIADRAACRCGARRWWPQLWRNAAPVRSPRSPSRWPARFAMFSRLAPLVRNHMNLRYIVNPIAGFTLGRAAVMLAPLFQKSTKLVSITAGAALGPSYARRSQAAAARHRRRRDGACRSLLAERLPARHQPRARRAGVFSFHDVRSCGTDTRDSVPCMFSPLGKAAFEKRRPSSRTCSTCCSPSAWPCSGSTTRPAARTSATACRPRRRPTCRPPSRRSCATAASASTRRCWSASTSASPSCPRSGAGAASSSSCTRWAATGRPTTSARRRRRSTSCPSAPTPTLGQCAARRS